MIKFIIDENPVASGAYLVHDASNDCEDLPPLNQQILIGYFANVELAYKRARMNWPKERVEACQKCCVQ